MDSIAQRERGGTIVNIVSSWVGNDFNVKLLHKNVIDYCIKDDYCGVWYVWWDKDFIDYPYLYGDPLTYDKLDACIVKLQNNKYVAATNFGVIITDEHDDEKSVIDEVTSNYCKLREWIVSDACDALNTLYVRLCECLYGGSPISLKTIEKQGLIKYDE